MSAVTISTSEWLYRLLPAIHRVRDVASGEPLRALVAVIQAELDRVDDHIARTYDNWFIETCEDWTIPYLGDTLGVRDLVPTPGHGSLRAYVAETIGFRQRKGTAAVLEDLARTATGWPCAAVETFLHLAATVHLDHVVPGRVRTPDLRDADALELLGGPFETARHFADIRAIGAAAPRRRGGYNIPAIALWVWRLEAFPVERAPAVADPAAGPSRYRCSPLGADAPLFAPDRSDDGVARTVELAVPAPIRRRPIFAELEAARAALAAGELPAYGYLAPDEPAFAIWELDSAGAATEVPPDRIQICDLSRWETGAAGLPAPRSYVTPDGVTVDARVAIDPVSGRLAFLPETAPPAGVRVSFRHGFPGPIGGGLYERSTSLAPLGDRAVFVVGGPAPTAATLADAIAAWAAAAPADAVIVLDDNAEHAVVDLAIPAAATLELRSADERRAVLRLGAPWRLSLGAGASVVIDGVLVVGAGIELATTPDEAPRRFALRHATLVPGHALGPDRTPVAAGAPSLAVTTGAAGRLTVEVTRSITGPIDLGALGGDGSALAVSESIVDAADGVGPALAGGAVTVRAATVLGAARVERLDATDAIFDAPVTAMRTQVGCVRYSYVPLGSRAPRGHRCQPALAIAATPTGDRDAIADQLRPRYTSRRFGEPGYGQLADGCAVALTRGAEDAGELGAWHFLQQPQREANLAIALDEYLRFGLEAGVFKAT